MKLFIRLLPLVLVVLIVGCELTHKGGFDVTGYVSGNSPIIGDGVADDTEALQALFATSPVVRLAPGTYRITSPLIMPRYGQLLGESAPGSLDGSTRIFVDGDFTGIVTAPNTLVRGVNVYGRADGTGSGIRIGSPSEFAPHVLVQHCSFRRLGTGVRYDNSFFTELDWCIVDDCATGIRIQPTTNGGDSGYTTTVTIRKCYIQNCSSFGIVESSPVRSSSLSITDSVIENNGSANAAQISIGEVYALELSRCYLEDSRAQRVVALSTVGGLISSCYFNGPLVGIYMGSGFADIDIVNCTFAGITGDYSLWSSGGALARITMRGTYFSKQPYLAVSYANYHRCSGALPTGTGNNATFP